MPETLWQRVLRRVQPSRRATSLQVLVISAALSDDLFYFSIPLPDGGHASVVHSVADALRLLRAKPFPVVLYDRDLPGQGWRSVLEQIVVISPDSCFLLVSSVSDEYLWKEVVVHGGYDVISRPLDPHAVTRTLRRAWNFWRAERVKVIP